MKTSNIQTSHNQAIVRGWVDPVAAGTDSSGGSSGSSGGSVGQFENPGLVAFVAGDVVVLASDGTITTTTTAQDTRPVGVVLDDIAAGDFGPVAWSGPVALVHVTASVTAGNYAETSTTAGDATENATRRAGSFGYFTSSGTTPSGYLFGGAPDSSTLSGVTVKDEGVALATLGTSLDFVGSGVTASGTGAAKTVTITAASAQKRILLADGRATPFAFTDLLQADDGSDFLYEDA